MAAFLFLPGLQGNFRLRHGTAESTRDAIEEAIDTGSTVTFEVEMGDNPLDTPSVTVNGAALPWFSVIETTDPALS